MKAALVIGGVVAGIALAIGSLFLYVALFSGPELTVVARVPSVVDTRSSFILHLEVDNPHDEIVYLDSIDIDSESLEGLEVVSVSPEPSENYHLPGFDQQSWSFGKSVSPGGRLDVQFELRALQSGVHQISLDSCNSYQDCSRTHAQFEASSP